MSETKSDGRGLLGRTLVGPVLRAGDFALTVLDAVQADNPGKEVFVEEHPSYVRIHTENECMIRRATMAELLGRPFDMQELQLYMSSFAGMIESSSDKFRFYLNASPRLTM